MLPQKEFYLVTTDTGAACQLGHPAQDAENRFPNRETAEAAAVDAWPSAAADVLYVVQMIRTTVAEIKGTTEVTVTSV